MKHRRRYPALRTPNWDDIAYLALISVAAIGCFYPLLQYFFAQDDFVLIEKVWRNGLNEFLAFFHGEPGHFRPVTKALYFGVTYPVFGLNALPYHVISMAFYLINIWLMYILLRRLGIGKHAAMTVMTMFGLSVAYFHIIAWISCIQQLMGQTFLLASLIFGLQAVDSKQKTPRVLSLAAYTFALLSYEQSFAAPLILLLIVSFPIGAGRKKTPWRAALQTLAPGLILMFFYLAFILLWKGRPDTGSYAFAYGKNIAINIMSYVGWVNSFGADLPTEFNRDTIPLGVGQASVALLIVYHLAKRRFMQVAFGVAYFLMTIGPALFLVKHTSYLHTYVSAGGFAYLIALAADDLFANKRLRGERGAWTVVAVAFVAMVVVSYTMVRQNEREQMHGDWGFKKSFVLRRAEIAENAYLSIKVSKGATGNVDLVYMVYGRPGPPDSFNRRNVISALGGGSAIRLFYENPGLEVMFPVLGDAITPDDLKRSHVYYFDDGGDCLPMHDRLQK